MTLEIVQIVQEASTAGGVETVALELSRAFGRARITNTLLTRLVDADLHERTRVILVSGWLARLPTRGLLRYVGRLLVVPVFTLAATRATRRHRSSVAISHGDSLRGDILVVHAVNAQSLAEKRLQGHWGWLFNPLHLWVSLRDRWMIGGLRYRRFVAVSARVAGELQQLYRVPAERIHIIPNGIDIQRFTADRGAGRAIRREFAIPEEAKLLLFAGHEFGRKGLAHVIGALELLPEDFYLLVVGSDNPAPFRRLGAGVASRVGFAGARSDMPACYSAADAFVLPTAYETFSLVCMEAMACSLPVFATRVGGIEDYLVDGRNGFGIEPDRRDIADKVRAVLEDPNLVQRLAVGARETALTYGWDAVGAKYLEVVRQIAPAAA